jgi:hypothetical protein
LVKEIKMTNQYEQQLQAERAAREQAQYDAVVNAIAASSSEAENAQRDYQYCSSVNDYAGMADAQRRMSRAESRLVQLENGRDAFDERRITAQQYQQQPSLTPEQIIGGMPLMPEEREWLLQHKHLVTNAASIQELQGAFHASQRLGLQRGSQEYLKFIEERVGADGDSAAGLTKEQLEHARISGISPESYAENYRKMKAVDAKYGPRYQR